MLPACAVHRRGWRLGSLGAVDAVAGGAHARAGRRRLRQPRGGGVGRTSWWAAQGFSPLDWLYQSWAYDAHDVGGTPGFAGDTAAALASIRAPTLIAAPPLDLYNPAPAARWAAQQIPGARFVELDTEWGHQSASAADPASVARLDGEIAALLAG
jgi:homoserine O-acetyltransferase